MLPGWQVPLLSQQPLGQVAAVQVAVVQAWLVQTSVALQATHAAPPLPQAGWAPPATQLPFASQQPLGQVVALQVAVTQAWL